MTPAVKFLAALFKRSAAPVFVCSLANDRSATRRIPPRSVVTRDGELVERYAAKWDAPERGLFFCVATLQPGVSRRAKSNLAEIVTLHADLDSKNIAATPEEIQAALASKVPPLPSIAVFSGHGLHLYWRLQQALSATPENIERIEVALRKVAGVFAGDPAVCECSRLMRLPGSHNTKAGEWLPVHVVSSLDTSYSIEALEKWLSTAEPLLQRRPSEKRTGTNAFSELGEAQVFAAPVDIDERLAAMEFHGPDEFSVHHTQLSVSAALLTRGWPIDAVVARVLDATIAAVGRDGRSWDWEKEERDLRLMCRKWLEKHPQVVFVED
jgi:hypothetical protein